MITDSDETPTTFFPSADVSDLDFSFNSTASTSSFATTFASSSSSSSSSSSARSSISLSLPSFSTSTSLINPLPHSKSNCSPHWSAVRAAAKLSHDGTLHLRHLHLLRHLGSGHLAKVFHCRLKGSDAFDFALKVVDLDAVAKVEYYDSASSDTGSSKLSHVRSEARVLAAVDHPFLPTLYARMDASHYACFLIDYCPGGDLHSLLVRHPGHRLPLSAARFFAAEVLLALEYLHALGYVYRDLKPENVLIRSDGHIMLSDFDLCFSSPELSPSLHRRRVKLRRRRSGGCWRVSGGGGEVNGEVTEEIELVAEPEGAFSRACVGTHEYLAPEIVGGNGHGNGVDWWALGVFIYELVYGRTPFKGPTKEATLRNIQRREVVKFPDEDDETGKAGRDLIRRLLVRDPKERMGCKRGAAEIKKHPFFQGVRWQLIRCERPPVAVGPAGAVVVKEGKMKKKKKKKKKKSSSSSSRGGGGGGGGWWWSRMVKSIISGKKGIKLGLVGSNYKSKRKGTTTMEKILSSKK